MLLKVVNDFLLFFCSQHLWAPPVQHGDVCVETL